MTLGYLMACIHSAGIVPCSWLVTFSPSRYFQGLTMHLLKLLAVMFVVAIAFSETASSRNDDRAFFDGLEARNVGPFRGGRATVAVGVRQDPHVYYMGTTGGVWKTENAGASWRPVSDEDFGSSSVGAIAVAASDPNVVVVGMGESPLRNIASSQGDGVERRSCPSASSREASRSCDCR